MTTMTQKAQAILTARKRALFKGRLRVDSDGDLIGDARSGVSGGVHVVASSSGDYVLMEEDAEFFAIAANHAADIAKAYLELEKEGLEQARLLGISGSVELKLLTKIASLEARLKHVTEGTVYCPSCGKKGVIKEDDGFPRQQCSNGHSWMSASQQEKYWMRLVSSLEARLKVLKDAVDDYIDSHGDVGVVVLEKAIARIEQLKKGEW